MQASFNPAQVPAALLQKYTQRVPRYTSYPTAPHFSENVDQSALWQRWRDSNRESLVPGSKPVRDLSVYMHIPFCQERCWFCGCNTSISKNPAVADGYINALSAEFDLVAGLIDSSRPIKQLALGGGTPTFLTPDRLDQLLTIFKKTWKIAPDAENSIEIDPRTVFPEHVDVLLQHGFNRFSMGVQDFDENVLDIIHRLQSLEHTRKLVDKLRQHGVNAFNFDLIYGLPGQTPETMVQTARTTAEFRPSRIALYSYAHVPWMKGHQKILERQRLPTPEEKLALFGTAYEELLKAGYIHIGMDHFALPEDELVKALGEHSLHRNFMGYTTRRGLDLLGFGASSISTVAETYVQNLKDEKDYNPAVLQGKMPLERGYILSREDSLRRELIIDLFCNFYLDGKAFGQRWQIDFASHFAAELKALEPMQADQLVKINDCLIEVTPMGRALIRNVCMVFDQYMEVDPERRMYSQAV